MGKDETRPVESGVTVRTVAFERLVQELAGDHQLFVMDPKGTPIHEQVFGDKPCFLLTDHIPMPKNTLHGLKRLGRSEEHTSELQSLMRNSYAVFCLKKKKQNKTKQKQQTPRTSHN